MILLSLITLYISALVKRGSNHALYSVMFRLLGSYYERVGIYKNGEAIYAATSEWHLQNCMNNYLNEETNTDIDDNSDSHLFGDGQSEDN